ncbi:MAG: hypothetical protein ACREU6_14325 [Steroidobacteraceae bacterium]
MEFATPMVETRADSVLRISGLVDRAVVPSEVSAADLPLGTDLALTAPSEEERDRLHLVEMRYQQHLTQRALQELFEIGALEGLEG